jgi:GT2 family glycosyltransferase
MLVAVVSLLILIYWLIWSVVLARGMGGLLVLEDLESRAPARPGGVPAGSGPPLSIVVAARNEEKAIGPALSSLLASDYPDLEILVVDDRSTDGTAMVLARLAAVHSRLHVLPIATLPPGWLGKTHALATGAAAARGDWILFTDADVHFGPRALRLAMGYAVSEDLDHLVVAPALVLTHIWERVLVATFRVCFNQAIQPWRARDPESPSALGLGAFNLVRRSAYERAGGHGAVRLAVDEDMRLGRVLKRAGARQEMILTRGLVRVRWHDGVRATIRGLTKNFFGALDYRPGRAALIIAMLLVLHSGPWALIPLASDGWARALALAAWLATAVAYRAAGEGWNGLGAPIGAVLTAVAIARSTAVTLARGGVEWRGTFYSLAELRAFVRSGESWPGASALAGRWTAAKPAAACTETTSNKD